MAGCSLIPSPANASAVTTATISKNESQIAGGGMSAPIFRWCFVGVIRRARPSWGSNYTYGGNLEEGRKPCSAFPGSIHWNTKRFSIMPDKPSDNPEITSRLKKSDAQLKELQHSVKTGMVNVKILMEFRQAIENARKATAAMQNWLEEQEKAGGDPFQLLPKVMTERMRIVTQLLKDVTHDVESGDIDFETPGLVELHQTLRTLTERMGRFFRE
jgi:hypothetical protein